MGQEWSSVIVQWKTKYFKVLVKTLLSHVNICSFMLCFYSCFCASASYCICAPCWMGWGSTIIITGGTRSCSRANFTRYMVYFPVKSRMKTEVWYKVLQVQSWWASFHRSSRIRFKTGILCPLPAILMRTACQIAGWRHSNKRVNRSCNSKPLISAWWHRQEMAAHWMAHWQQ